MIFLYQSNNVKKTKIIMILRLALTNEKRYKNFIELNQITKFTKVDVYFKRRKSTLYL